MNEKDNVRETDPYVYKNTNVLINKFNERDKESLLKIENELATIRLYELAMQPIKGEFDYKHFCEVNRYIFQDVYKWAGEPRTIDIEKQELVLSGFSLEYTEHVNIKNEIKEILDNLKTIDWKQLSIDETVNKFTKSMSELWKVHAFREGNTRTIITFYSQFAEDKGFPMQIELLKTNAAYVRNALVAANAYTKEIGDKRNPTYLQRIVKDSILQGKEIHKQEYERLILGNQPRTDTKAKAHFVYGQKGKTFNDLVEEKTFECHNNAVMINAWEYKHETLKHLVDQLCKDNYDIIINVNTDNTGKERISQFCELLERNNYPIELNVIAVKPEMTYLSYLEQLQNSYSDISPKTAKTIQGSPVDTKKIEELYKSRYFDNIHVYNKDMEVIYNQKETPNKTPAKVINHENKREWTQEEIKDYNERIDKVIKISEERQPKSSEFIKEEKFRVNKIIEKYKQITKIFKDYEIFRT